MTKPADERTAKEREQLRERAKKYAKEHDWWDDSDPVVDDLTDFAESERSSAIKEAREECARAMCETCANGDEPVKTDVGWCHAGVMPGEYVFCSAQEIRALGER